MPVYEYRCQDCNKLSSVFARSMAEPPKPECSHCSSTRTQRAVSSFAYHKSSKSINKSSPAFDAPGTSLEYYSDPSNVGRHIEESFNAHGVEMPDSVRDTIDSARQGETPKGLDI